MKNEALGLVFHFLMFEKIILNDPNFSEQSATQA